MNQCTPASDAGTTRRSRAAGPETALASRCGARRKPAGEPDARHRRCRRLLQLHLGAGLLELRLDLLAFLLRDAFLHGLRGAFDEILGLLQAEARDHADLLDDLDLLVAHGGENDRELGLLLNRRGGGAAA